MKTTVSIAAGWLLLTAGTALGGEGIGVVLTTSETETPEPRRPEIVISFADPTLRGGANPAVVAESLGLEDVYSFGVERLYWENDPDADWRVYLDSQFRFRPDDLSVRFEAFQADEKYFNLDFQLWEKYDYGSGIYYPPTDASFMLSPEQLSEEIMQLKVSYRFLPSSESSWKVSYSFFERSGSSLSTRFGDDYQYIATSARKSRGIVPAVEEGKETIHSAQLEFKKQSEVKRSGVRVHWQRRESERTRVVERAASSTIRNRTNRHAETTKDDLFGGSGYIRRQLTDRMYGSLGLAYTRLDGDITGNRVFGSDQEASYDIDFAATQLDDRGFVDLEGTRALKQWIMNGNVVYDPEGNYRWMAGVRVEHLSTSMFGSYLDTWKTFDYADRAVQSQEANFLSNSEKSADDLSAFLEVRYKGFSKAHIYSRVELASQEGDLSEGWSREEVLPNPSVEEKLLSRLTGFERSRTFWELGINYYPTSNFRVSLEGYVKIRENNYDSGNASLAAADWTAYPTFIKQQDFTTEDLNARVHWKVFPWLKSVSRVDFQMTRIDSIGHGLNEVRGSVQERMVFNQSIVLAPHPRFFMNACYQLVDDLTETRAGALQTTASGIVVNLPNDYWQLDVNAFYVVSKRIDLQIGYHYLEMSNYIDNSPKTVPYGSDLEQYHGSASVILHFSDRTLARIGYHYYEQTELASPGDRDYTLHMVKTTLQHTF